MTRSAWVDAVEASKEPEASTVEFVGGDSKRPNVAHVTDEQWEAWTDEVLDLCTKLVPWGIRPEHLREWVRAILMSTKGRAREMISIPIQHYKSTTTLIAIAWILKKWPGLSIVLMQHSHDKAVSSGQSLREYAAAIGVKFKTGQNRIADWRTDAGGGCVVISVKASAIGFPIDILLVDDPLNEHTSGTKKERDEADEQIDGYTMRAAVNLNSVLMVASPWTDDDPIIRRRMRTEVRWNYVHHQGIIDYGEPTMRAFAPKVMSLDALLFQRREMFETDPTGRRWLAQVQCRPLPPALGFFVGEYEFAGEIPSTAGYMYGVDCAFTQGIKSDWTATVGGAMLGDFLCVDHAFRGQIGLQKSAEHLVRLRDAKPYARFVTYTSGPEVGVYQALMQQYGLNIEQMPARFNKATRSQKTAASWQRALILIRFGQPWTGPLLHELHSFDGRETGVDDQADALVALHDAAMSSKLARDWGNNFTFGSPGAAG
jgi:phage terminase large subunit-like protein